MEERWNTNRGKKDKQRQ